MLVGAGLVPALMKSGPLPHTGRATTRVAPTTFGTMGNMRRVLSAACIFLALFALAGCIDIQIKTIVYPDGSGSQSWKFTTTALLANQIKQQLEKDSFFRKLRPKITEEFKEGDYILGADIPFKDVTELQNGRHIFRFEKSGIFKRTYFYTESWEQAVDDRGFLTQNAGGLVPITLKVSLELPGKIVDSNAEVVEGSIAKWSLPVTDLFHPKSLWAKSEKWNLLFLAPLVLLSFAGAAAVAFLLTRTLRRKEAAAQVRCSNCGGGVPGGSAFCNVCGTKLNG